MCIPFQKTLSNLYLLENHPGNIFWIGTSFVDILLHRVSLSKVIFSMDLVSLMVSDMLFLVRETATLLYTTCLVLLVDID